MTMPEYLADVARQMAQQGDSIKRDFATHNVTNGTNKEHLVETFLREHLPSRFTISSGLVFSHDGVFSKQADVLVVDNFHNAPLYGSYAEKLWPVEAVYALIEVKSSFTPTNIQDALIKGKRFKELRRNFLTLEGGATQYIRDSLFVMWSFEGPKPEIAKKNLATAMAGLNPEFQPDFFVVPDSFVVTSGQYLSTKRIGQPQSPKRARLVEQHGDDLSKLYADPFEIAALGDNGLFAWFTWFDSWLRHAGARSVDPTAYIPLNKLFGHEV